VRTIERALSGITSAPVTPRLFCAHRGEQLAHAMAVSRIEPQHLLEHARGLVTAFEPP
jgi:hypothetical protein